DGLLNLDEFAELTDVTLPEGPYETAAGYVMSQLGSVPQVGDAVDIDGHRLTVSALDGRRISRLRLTPVERPNPDPGADGDQPGTPA
ncbi:MAG: hypothetical protein M3O55_09595, partial [Actinomycetota bacterium]|nr:hypothetical protein [Actinomycetota bacterium]